MTDAEGQIAAELKKADPDRYLSVLYAPADKRADLFALYAFNAEIASIRDRIREPLPGEVRIQWWRDVIAAGTVDAAGGHPLATALLQTIERHSLPASAFQNYLDARVFDLYDDPMPSRGDLEGYLGETASAIIQLACLILDRDAAQSVANLAGHAGCAQGVAGLLQLVPLHRARGQCYVPADLLAAAGTTSQEFVSGSNEPAASRALAAMVALGREHWMAYRRNPLISRALLPAFVPLSATDLLLDKITCYGGRALTTPVPTPHIRKHLRSFLLAIAGGGSG